MLLQVWCKNKNYVTATEVLFFKLSLMVVTLCCLSGMLGAAALKQPPYDPAFGTVMDSDENLKPGKNNRAKKPNKVRPEPVNDFQRGVVAHMDDPNCFGPVVESEYNLRNLRATAATAASDDGVAVEHPCIVPLAPGNDLTTPSDVIDGGAHRSVVGRAGTPLQGGSNVRNVFQSPRVTSNVFNEHNTQQVSTQDLVQFNGASESRVAEVPRTCCQRLLYYICCGCCCKK